ncbi:hypothetical protein K438DRAFT_353281 [Mycena galopus ATCC 62051]|nr:hypothetical protein K438DRAFT_353281 [Mycena galopus ATCC 62051]
MAHSYTPPGSSSSSRYPPHIPSQLGIAHPWPDSPSHSLGSSGDASEAGSSVASFNDIHLEVDGDGEEGIVMESRGGRGQQGVQGPGVGQGVGASPYGRGAVTILTSDYDEVDALLHSIYEKTQQDAWFAPGPSAGAIADACLGGVALRVAAGAPSLAAPPSVAAAAAANVEDEEASGTSTPGDRGPQFRVFPYNAPHLVPFEAAVRLLNPAGAVLVRSAAVTAACAKIPATDHSVYIDAATRIQVLGRMGDLPGAEKDQCGAFIRKPPSLVLWAPAVEALAPLAAEFEEKLIKFIWRVRTSVLLPSSTSAPNTAPPPTANNGTSFPRFVPYLWCKYLC